MTTLSTDDLKVISWTMESEGPRVEVHPGVSVPTRVRASGPCGNIPILRSAKAEGIDDVDLSITAVFDPTLAQYRLASLAVEAIDGREVNGQILRGIPPYGIMRWLLPRAFHVEPGSYTEAIRRYALGFEGLTPILAPDLSDVATVYRLASVVRDPPSKAVAQMFGFQPRTATNWIKRARESGYAL